MAGPRDAEPAGEALARHAGAWWTREGFLHGAVLWNRGRYWEAHEAWEAPWRAAGRDTPTGRFLQGLILLAAAAVKHEVGAHGAARRLAARAARRLGEGRAAEPPFDAFAFAAAVEAWVGGTRAAPPRLELVPRRDAEGR